MVSPNDCMYQEGGVRYPDAVSIDIAKHPKVELKEISKLTGWWGEEGILGLEIEHGGISVKGYCESAHKTEPPHYGSLKMAEGEYVTEIYGQNTSKIEQLTFRTSRGTTITFGNPKPDASNFRLFQKNHRIAAVTIGVSKHIHFIGAYFTYLPFISPSMVPHQEELPVPKISLEEEQKIPPQFPKAIDYERPKEITMVERKALDNPETYGKFNDFESVIKNQIKDGKKVSIREIMLYYSTVKKTILGYRLKYEIRDPSKTTGKIVELKHVAPNPMTPTLHMVELLDEKELIVKVKGIRSKTTECISYLAFITNMGKTIEAGSKEKEEASEEFELEGEEEKNIIAFAGKVTDGLNAIGIYCVEL